LFRNYKFFESLISFNNKEINAFRVDIKKLVDIKKDLSLKNKSKQTDKLEVEKKILNLRQIKRNKLVLIRKINNDKGKYTKLKDELEHEFLKFNNSLMGENKVKNIVSDSEIEELKGMFTWPIKGEVITQFGKQKSTKFNTYIINTGIEIKPKTSQNKISTIYSGNIVFSDYWKGYGKMIVVQHSKHFLSFYGHCKDFLKKKGDSVNEGEKIAIIGDTGSANVKSLYFEIRKNMVAQNPIKWLAKK
jgi:murein DD-endopeptidase MepM/ murein hydrolase activator NlpD